MGCRGARVRGSSAAVIAIAIAAVAPPASGQTPAARDAGPGDAAPPAVDAVSADDEPPPSVESANQRALADAAAMRAVAAKLDALPGDVPTLPEGLAGRFGDTAIERPEVARLIALERRQEAGRRRLEAEALDGSAPPKDAGKAATLAAIAERSRARATLADAEAGWLERTQEAREAKLTGDDERALTLRKAQSQREERDAAEAKRKAQQDQLDARTPAQLAISAAREELESLRGAQAKFEQKLLRRREQLASLAASHVEFLERLHQHATLKAAIEGGGESRVIGVDDPLFHTLSAELAGSRVAALGAILASLHAPPRPPAPGSIQPELLALRSDHPGEIEALLEQREALEIRATALAAESRQTARDELAQHVAETQALTGAMVALLAASPRLRGQLRSLRAETSSEVRGEAIQFFVLFADWARRRLGQLSRIGDYLTDWSHLASMTWMLVKLLLLLALLRWALGQWKDWMQLAVETVGATLSYGQAALLLVRIAESAKHFGPPVLVLGFAIASYSLFADIGGEIEIALALLIAIAAIRVQLRIIEALSDRMATRAIDKERERQLLELEHAGEGNGEDPDSDEPHHDREPELPPPPDPAQSGWKLLAVTWRRLTRYVSIFAILLVITDHTIGRGVFWGLVIRWGWLGAIPLTLFFLRTWRQRIVDELNKRAPGQKGAGPLSRLAKNHSHRFYGVFIVFAAFLVVLGRRSAGFVRDHLSNLDSTRRMLAFLFRRRVQKHAREHGRVLEKPHPLPAEILAQFPTGPVPVEMRPMRPSPLAAITEAYKHWKSEGADGSVALVGANCSGKSTVLNLLPRTLDAEVERLQLTQKITAPELLVKWLAHELGCEGGIRSEGQLVAALRAAPPRVVAIDDCHNLYLRDVGGFEAWNAFVRIINETCDRIFWVLALSQPAWEYLDNIDGDVVYFRVVIEMPAWTETQLRRLILTRMRRARYKVNFSDLLVTRLEGVKVSSQIIRTSQGYFRLLWDYANGNPGLACFFWLRSLVPDAENMSVRVHLFAAPRIEELQALPDDIAFVLTAVVEHHNATATELATITNLSKQICRFAVNFCVERGYLTRDGGRVSLSPLWQQTVYIYLKRKHLLYS